jgi:hypothetical protein
MCLRKIPQEVSKYSIGIIYSRMKAIVTVIVRVRTTD